MKSLLRFQVRAAILSSLLTALLPSWGCASKVFFDGVALVRTNGDVIVVQKADSVKNLKDGEDVILTDTEIELLTRLATRRDRAHDAAHGSAMAAGASHQGRCLTGLGNPPTCYSILPCKGCHVVAQGTSASGEVEEPKVFLEGDRIPYSAPYAYYCECDLW